MSSSSQPAIGANAHEPAVADAGKRRIDWAFQSMPVLQVIRKQFIRAQPFSGVGVVTSLTLTPEVANLMVTLRDGGAVVTGCACSLPPFEDEVAASLTRDYGIDVIDRETALYRELGPILILDSDGGFSREYHGRGAHAPLGIVADSAAGANRLRRLEREGTLLFPVFDLSESWARSTFDARYGTGPGSVDAIVRTTGLVLAGLTFVVAGYGRIGQAVASRARALGAHVIVTEVDPVRAVEAVMDGCRVMSMGDAAVLGDVFCTATGNRGVIARDHFERMKNGAVVANAGHSEVEIDLEALARLSSLRRHPREAVEEHAMRDGRRIYVLSAGRPMVHAAGAQVLDAICATQALLLEYIIRDRASLERKVHPVPGHIDRSIAGFKIEAAGINIDRLSVEQEQYLAGWSEGTETAGCVSPARGR